MLNKDSDADVVIKFMSSTVSASIFTENLLSVIRQQRHLATRVIIATQEPTISPKLLDLCTITIVHRFTSPEWFTALKSHLAGTSSVDDEAKRNPKDLFRIIVNLNAGEALLFSPSAMLNLAEIVGEDGSTKRKIEKLGMRFVKMRVRKRLSVDGGKSVMAA